MNIEKETDESWNIRLMRDGKWVCDTGDYGCLAGCEEHIADHPPKPGEVKIPFHESHRITRRFYTQQARGGSVPASGAHGVTRPTNRGEAAQS